MTKHKTLRLTGYKLTIRETGADDIVINLPLGFCMDIGINDIPVAYTVIGRIPYEGEYELGILKSGVMLNRTVSNA